MKTINYCCSRQYLVLSSFVNFLKSLRYYQSFITKYRCYLSCSYIHWSLFYFKSIQQFEIRNSFQLDLRHNYDFFLLRFQPYFMIYETFLNFQIFGFVLIYFYFCRKMIYSYFLLDYFCCMIEHDIWMQHLLHQQIQISSNHHFHKSDSLNSISKSLFIGFH